MKFATFSHSLLFVLIFLLLAHSNAAKSFAVFQLLSELRSAQKGIQAVCLQERRAVASDICLHTKSNI